MKRLIPPVLFLICVILMVLCRWLWPWLMVFPPPYNLWGIVSIMAGLLVGFLGVRQFRQAQTNIHPFMEADKLVTQGPFRYTRNPMYLGLTLVLVGVGMLLGNLSSLLGVLLFVVVADRWYIRWEERMLRKKFGPAFDAYCAATRRWF